MHMAKAKKAKKAKKRGIRKKSLRSAVNKAGSN
jgi:hypothetical protein